MPSAPVALITGAGSGIGAAAARALSGAGFALLLGDVNEQAVTEVAGASHRLDALQDGRFTPPKPVRLVAENNNQYDANAVAIYSEDRRVMAGYVPRELA